MQAGIFPPSLSHNAAYFIRAHNWLAAFDVSDVFNVNDDFCTVLLSQHPIELEPSEAMPLPGSNSGARERKSLGLFG